LISIEEEIAVAWKVRGIRGATTVTVNCTEAIAEAVTELLDRIEQCNQFDPEDIVSVFFTVTADLDAVFPAAIARHRRGWNYIPLMDLQHMQVEKGLPMCIRILIHVNTQLTQLQINHCYLRNAASLRPDLAISEEISQPTTTAI
jgi:chorismate mutase